MVLKNPDNFFKIFLASIIIGSGAKIEGYPVLDEFWIIMLLFGLFLRKFLIKRLNTEKKKDKNYNLHEKAFMLLTIYFLFQSFRGGIWLEDPRMLRWVVFFIIIIITFFIFSNLKQTIDPHYANKIVIYSTTIYFLLLFVLTYIYELSTGKSKGGVLQDLYISGSTVSTFTIIIYVIALINFNQTNKSIKKNIKGLSLFVFLSFIIVTSTVVYYDSRAGVFTILGALGLNFLFQFLQRNKRGLLQFYLIISFLIGYQFWAINYSEGRKIQDFLPIDSELNLVLPKNLAQQTEGQGRARSLAPKASFDFLTEDLFHALFGYGWYMSRYELIEPIQQMRKYEQLRRLNLSKDKPYQAAGATAIMVDTGFIGIFLYLLNLLLGFLSILKSQNNNKYVISIIYLSVVLFSFVGTLTSVLLFYFWVMPKNPIILMLEKNESKT